MPSYIQPSNVCLAADANMEFSLELKNSLKQQQNSRIAKKMVPSPQANQSLKYQDKFKVNNCVGPPYGDMHHEALQDADDGIFVQPKFSGNLHKQIKGKATKDDELVKYMSNLPGYLQRMERGENIQEKALNVGVLDWARLEEWKYNQKCSSTRGNNNASSTSSNSSLKRTLASSTSSSAVQSETLTHRSDQCSSFCSSLNSSRKDGNSRSVKSSSQNVMHFQDSETASKSTLDGQEKIPWTYKSSGRSHSDVVLGRGKKKDIIKKIPLEKGNLSSNLRSHGISLRPNEIVSAWNGEAKERGEELQESDISRKNLDQSLMSDAGDLSLRMSAGNGETKKKVEKMQESDIVLAHQHSHGKHKNIVLRKPGKLPQNSFPEVFPLLEPRALFDENLTEANWNSFSDGFSPEEVHSAELSSKIPHSCPLLSGVETSTEPDMMPHSMINAQGLELSHDASHTSPCSNKTPNIISGGKYAEKNDLNIKPTDSSGVDTSKILDLGTAELAAGKGRHPSPNHRFSFSLGQMRRSLSFKEGSAVPQLSSTYVTVKSGPVRSQSSACLENSNREKANAQNRARSSPLRRLLDPLLKFKAANPLLSATTVQPLKGNLNSLSCKPINNSDSLQNEKHEASTVKALLQLTVKNGLPLFKFVVDNNSNIFAATMKNSTTSEKDGPGGNVTFYSVNEIKKKTSSWIHGSKEKSCGYSYNVVGQMRVSSKRFSDLTRQNSEKQFMVREFVLLGVELRQADQEPPKFMPNRELAAIVVKIPTGNLNYGGQQSDMDKDLLKCFMECLPEDRCSCNLGKNEYSNSTTVILPGGVHGLPNKGLPSPLIDRWKSGGSCDCGGWDVGCKLRVLSNQNKCYKILGSPKVRPMSDCFELFFQEGTQQKKSIFSLAPLKMGIYSVEFNASVSLLQAFFISVAVISSQKSSDHSEVRNRSKAKVVLQEPTLNGNDGIKTHATVQGEVPARYFPNPPLSPVGRV